MNLAIIIIIIIHTVIVHLLLDKNIGAVQISHVAVKHVSYYYNNSKEVITSAFYMKGSVADDLKRPSSSFRCCRCENPEMFESLALFPDMG